MYLLSLFSRLVMSVSATPWTAARWASLFFNISQGLLKLMSVKSVMTSNHLILCHPLLLLPSVFPSIRVFSNESALCIRWPNIGASLWILWPLICVERNAANAGFSFQKKAHIGLPRKDLFQKPAKDMKCQAQFSGLGLSGS